MARPIMTSERREMQRLYALGVSRTQIAHMVGRTAPTVANHTGGVSTMRHVALVGLLHAHGLCLDKIQRALGVPPAVAIPLIREHAARAAR